MKLEQIEQVLAIVSCGSISQAAETLYMKQPNLSTSIKSLENELGFPLFSRSPHGMELTKFGHYFVSFAEPILDQMKSLENMCQSLKEHPQISFCVSSQYFKFITNTFISLYQRYRGSNLALSLLEVPFSEVIDNVIQQKSEIGVLALPSSQKKGYLHLFKAKRIEFVKLCECPPYVVLGKENPYYQKDPPFLTIEQLSEYPYISYQPEKRPLYAFDVKLRTMGHYNRITVSDRSTLNEILLKTDAFFLATHVQAAYQSTPYYPNIKAIPLQGLDMHFEIGWIRQLGGHISKIASEFMMLLEDIL